MPAIKDVFNIFAKAKKPLKLTLKYAVLPLALTFTGAVAAHFGSSFLLPTAEEYAKKKGHNSHFVRNFVTRNVRIQDLSTFTGRLHARSSYIYNPFDLDPLKIDLQEAKTSLTVQDVEWWDIKRHLMKLFNVSYIKMPAQKTTLTETLSKHYRIKKEWFESDILSPEEANFITFMHELAHTRQNGSDTPRMAEAIPDIIAIDSCKEKFDIEKIKTAWIHTRALSFGSDHDNCLYLDAHYNNRRKPDEDDMSYASFLVFYEAEKINSPYGPINTLDIKFGDFGNNPLFLASCVDRFESLLREKKLWGSSRQRAEMFLEAVDFFSPSFKKNMPALLNTPQKPSVTP